jgi:hypothetical protein
LITDHLGLCYRSSVALANCTVKGQQICWLAELCWVNAA